MDDLHAKGRIVQCYLSAGSAENWRYDYYLYPKIVMGGPLVFGNEVCTAVTTTAITTTVITINNSIIIYTHTR